MLLFPLIGANVLLTSDEGLLGLMTMTARLLCEKGAGQTSIRVTKMRASASIKRQAYAIQGTEVRFFMAISEMQQRQWRAAVKEAKWMQEGSEGEV